MLDRVQVLRSPAEPTLATPRATMAGHAALKVIV